MHDQHSLVGLVVVDLDAVDGVLKAGALVGVVVVADARLVLELDDVSMSESPESEQAARELNNNQGMETNSVMRDWMLVAAGIERFFLMVYTIAFGLRELVIQR